MPTPGTRLGRLLGRVDTDVEDVASSQDYVSVVCRRGVATVLGGSFQYDVHVAVGIDHFAAVFDIALQPNVNVAVEFLHEQVERFSRRFQMCTTDSCGKSRPYAK